MQDVNRPHERRRVGLEEAEVDRQQIVIGAGHRIARDQRERAVDDRHGVPEPAARRRADLGTGTQVDDSPKAHLGDQQAEVRLGRAKG